jgi:dephospho-CoA kinase
VIVLGLTGSIGMGKSTASAVLRRLGVPLFDADAAVHRLLAPHGAAVARVEAAFPGVRNTAGGIDRPALGRRVFGQPEALKKLESILHPIVRAAEKRFIAASRGRREPVIVLDIPLLFETRAESLCDGVIVVSAPTWLQRQRVMRRPGMTDSRLKAILGAQIPDSEKRRRADFVVSTGLSKAHTLRTLQALLRLVRQGQARVSATRCMSERRRRAL